jgi:hypothetical protein
MSFVLKVAIAGISGAVAYKIVKANRIQIEAELEGAKIITIVEGSAVIIGEFPVGTEGDTCLSFVS